MPRFNDSNRGRGRGRGGRGRGGPSLRGGFTTPPGGFPGRGRGTGKPMYRRMEEIEGMILSRW